MKCPLCGETVDPHPHWPLDNHMEEHHGLPLYLENKNVCWCGERFFGSFEREAHLRCITDWPTHITLGVLQQL